MPVSIPETVFLFTRQRAISDHVKATIEEYTKRLARSLHVIGLINIQFIVSGRGCICDRGEPAFQPYRAIYQ